MPRPLQEQVIAITGASSGIGRATAEAAAARGAAVVLIARNEVALRTTAREIETAGGRALAAVADVARYEEVEQAVAAAILRFGRIDTWVNNASVYAVAPVERMSVEEIERVLHVNVMGTVHGTKAVLPHFIEQSQGAFINVSSVAGVRALPLIAAYSASKHAIKAFSEALRLELMRDHPNIHVTTILPSSINTPIFRNALARIGAKPHPFPPIYPPQIVADAILASAEKPKRDVYAGSGRGIAMLEGLAPGALDRLLMSGNVGFRAQTTTEADDGVNNLFAPLDAGRYDVAGEWGSETKPDSIAMRVVELHPTRAKLALALAAGGAVALARRTGR